MTAGAPEPPPRPLTGGAVMAAASRVTVALTGAATTIFVARLLGPEGTGGFAIALTLVLMLTVLASLGVEHGIAYYVSSGRWAPRDALRSAQRVAVLAGVGGALLGVLARVALPSAFGGLSVADTIVVVGALPFALAWFYASFVALAVDRYEAYVVPPAAQSATAMVLVVALAAVADLSGAIVALAASHVIVAAGTLLWTRRRLPERPGDPAAGAVPGARLRAAMVFGAKGYAANALQFLNYRLDFFILSAVTSAAAVGRYSVAIAVTGVLWLAPQALSEVLFPRVAALSADDRPADRELRAMVEAKSLRHSVMLVLVTGAAVAAALAGLVVPVYGEGFREAIELGLILLPGVALIGVANVLSATTVGRGHPEYSLYVTLIVTPLTLVAYGVLVPTMEAQGAALAKTLSFAANFALVVAFYRRLTGAGRAADFVPTRSELADYRALPRAIRQWAGGLRS